MRDLVVQSAESKHLFYESVRHGWDLKGRNLDIKYDTYSAKPYKWTINPIRERFSGFSWEETMLWIGMKIGYRALCEEVWGSMSNEDKMANILNV